MPLPKVKVPSESSAPQSSTQQDLERPTAIQIYEHVARNGRRELARSNTTLAISGIVGGLTMGLTGLAHCIASSGEILSAVVSGHVATLAYVKWLGLATSGNIAGGVILVALLEYGQSKLE
jgi:formate/nitrite transporter FocA (FNT family)